MLEQAVTSNLAPITGKLCKMIRMLASDCDGDVIAAARAIKRTLRSEGLDIHELQAAHPQRRSRASASRARPVDRRAAMGRLALATARDEER
jgi:hypothetical protein